MKRFLPFIFLVTIIILAVIFSIPSIFNNKLPIPSDTIVGLYHPFRDLHIKEYPNGIPFKNSLITDPVRQQYPWRNLVIDLEKKFQLPLWNPYNFAGTPLLPNFQSASFYPLNILLFILPFSIGWSVLILAQPILAGFFLYHYLENLRLDRKASILGALTFAFCGFATSWLEWGTILHTALWLPLILLSTDKIFAVLIKRKNSKVKFLNKKLIIWSFIFTLSLVFSFFAGHLQTFIYLSCVSFAYGIIRWWQFGKSVKALILFLIAASGFLVITFLQWWPSLQFILLSARSVDQDWEKIGWFIPWQNLIQFVAPDFFGNPTTLNYWGIWNYAEFVGYVGILPMLLSLFALLYRRDKRTLFFGYIFLISLLFSLPNIIAKIPYVLQIPFISSTQPTRLLYLTDFALSVLAAFGLDLFIKLQNKKRIIVPLLFMSSIFAVLWGFVLFGYKHTFSTGANDILVAQRNLYLPTLLFFTITILILAYVFIKNNKYRNLLVVILLVVSFFDLLRFSQKFTPFAESKYIFPPSATTSYLQKQNGVFRIMTTDDRILPPNFSIMYSLQTLDGYDPLYLLRYGELIAAIERNMPDISPPFGFNRIITPNNVNSNFIDLLGVRYVLSLSDIKSSKLQKVHEEGQTIVYRNNQAYDRVFLVKNVKSVANKNDSINAMFKQNISFKETAVVENWDHAKTGFANGSASIVQYSEDGVVVATQSDGESFLVLMDTYYPTWSAQVCSADMLNCQKTKIYLTNYNFRGIVIPKGEHKIMFSNSIL